MSGSKDLSSYPQSLVDLSFGIPRPDGKTLPFPSLNAAKAYRLKFYGYRRALRIDPKNARLAENLAEVEITLQQLPDGTATLTFRHPDDNPMWRHLQEALPQVGAGAISPPPPVAAPERSEAVAPLPLGKKHGDLLESLGYGTTGNFAALLSPKPPTDEGGSGPQES